MIDFGLRRIYLDLGNWGGEWESGAWEEGWVLSCRPGRHLYRAGREAVGSKESGQDWEQTLEECSSRRQSRGLPWWRSG